MCAVLASSSSSFPLFTWAFFFKTFLPEARGISVCSEIFCLLSIELFSKALCSLDPQTPSPVVHALCSGRLQARRLL